VSSPIGGLLSAPIISARRVVTDADAWDVRLAALAALGQYDALTFVTADGSGAPAMHNLVDHPASDPSIRAAVTQVAESATTAQLRASVLLADGRIASAVLVTPLAPSDAYSGALVALRVGRPFAAVDTYTAVSIAELVSLELASSLTALREANERRQAFTLYELARQALFGEDVDETLQSIAMLLATTLEHQAAHIWLRRPDRSLWRHAAFPPDRLPFETLWENEHDALWGALRERRLVRMSGTTAPWIPSNTGDVLVVPLRSDPRPVGILVLARAGAPYGYDDVEMADVIGTFIGRIVARGAAAAPTRPGHAAEAPGELDTEVELAERS
jgi:GAF domain